jgi:hypothetical protein
MMEQHLSMPLRKDNRVLALSLSLAAHQYKRAISHDNLQRIVKLNNMFKKLTVPMMNEECALLPFSAKVEALNYTLDSRMVLPEAFRSLNIVPKDLIVQIKMPDWLENWHAVPVALLNRLAEVGDLDQLGIAILDCWADFQVDLAAVTEALIGVITGNIQLTHLNLSGMDWLLGSNEHMPGARARMQRIFDALGDHQGLRTLTFGEYPCKSAEDDYSLLERLLSRNRKIMVYNSAGERISNGTTVDKVYALNALYNGSSDLEKESSLARPLLVAMALTKGPLIDFQYSALMLARQSDVLCLLAQGIIFDDDNHIDTIEQEMQQSDLKISTPPESPPNDGLKRKSTIQLSSDGKKASRIEK